MSEECHIESNVSLKYCFFEDLVPLQAEEGAVDYIIDAVFPEMLEQPSDDDRIDFAMRVADGIDHVGVTAGCLLTIFSSVMGEMRTYGTSWFSPMPANLNTKLKESLRSQVEKLHQAGVCHGDISADNIRSFGKKDLVLVDWDSSHPCRMGEVDPIRYDLFAEASDADIASAQRALFSDVPDMWNCSGAKACSYDDDDGIPCHGSFVLNIKEEFVYTRLPILVKCKDRHFPSRLVSAGFSTRCLDQINTFACANHKYLEFTHTGDRQGALFGTQRGIDLMLTKYFGVPSGILYPAKKAHDDFLRKTALIRSEGRFACARGHLGMYLLYWRGQDVPIVAVHSAEFENQNS